MKTAHKTLAILPVLLPAIMCLISCDGEDKEDVADLSRVAIASGNNQTERVGAVLPEPLTVRVTDISGQPKFGAPVIFSTHDPGAVVNPGAASTDRDGYASAEFRLGSVPGNQSVGVRSGTDSTTFNHTANALGCTEEDPGSACQWPKGHIYITTTSSALLLGSGSVLLDFDPGTGAVEKVLETGLILRDIDFSSRGEMFVTTNEKIYKVLPGTQTLEEYGDIPILTGSEIEFNMGGVLALVCNTDVYMVGCPGTPPARVAEYYTVNFENLATDPVTRDFYVATGSGPLYNIFLNEWDGMGGVTASVRLELNTGSGKPRGMCVDMDGFLYVTIDGNDNSRSVARIKAGMEIDPKWFDFFDYFGGNNLTSGRWGDITVLGDYLYLIDTRMNRLVVLDCTGTTDETKFAGEFESKDFSLDGSDSERYGIAAVPEWQVCVEPD